MANFAVNTLSVNCDTTDLGDELLRLIVFSGDKLAYFTLLSPNLNADPNRVFARITMEVDGKLNAVTLDADALKKMKINATKKHRTSLGVIAGGHTFVLEEPEAPDQCIEFGTTFDKRVQFDVGSESSYMFAFFVNQVALKLKTLKCMAKTVTEDGDEYD